MKRILIGTLITVCTCCNILATCYTCFFVPIPNTYSMAVNYGWLFPYSSYGNSSGGLCDKYLHNNDTGENTLVEENIKVLITSHWSGSSTSPPSGTGCRWSFMFPSACGSQRYDSKSLYDDLPGSDFDFVWVFP